MSSYRQIFKSTALVGGAQVITTIVGIVRTKALALMLGTSGMGLAGLYMSATGLVGSIAGLGIGTSGVRQIAEAAAKGDERRVACTVQTLRFTALLSGLVGTLVVLCCCVPIGRLTFGDDQHAWGMAVVSFALLFSNVSNGQIALLQGLRRLKDMVTAEIVGAVFGTVASIVLVYFLKDRGVPWFLVAMAAFAILTSWWFARRVPVAKLAFHWRELIAEARGLVGLGLAIMIAGLVAAGVAYLSRVLIRLQLGLDAAGLFQATWALSTYYVGFILNAMSADFTPRLAAAENDHAAVNRMINEQVEMGVLIALPGVLATITLAPWVLRIFYSKDFVAAADIIRWQVMGVFLRVVCWPLGYVMIAKKKSLLFATTEIAWGVLNVALILLCVKLWRLEGIGIAFAVFYLFVTITVVFICWRLTGFQWSATALKILAPAIAIQGLVFACSRFRPGAWSLGIGLAATVAAGVVSLLALQKLLGVNLWQGVRRKFQPRTP
ncbi:MAG: O-antigen translocase [Verrucomicrobiota bacterium]|jgi:PST family polysaccharide transporter